MKRLGKLLHPRHRNLVLLFMGIIFGVLCGIYFPSFTRSIEWIGILFINLLKMIALPLIASAVISAVASLGTLQKLGSIGLTTLLFTLLSLSMAVLIGIVLINIFKPGVGMDPNLILQTTELGIHNKQPVTVTGFITSLVPSNIVKSAAQYEIMSIVFFSIFFSIACLAIGPQAKPVLDFFVGLRTVLIKMILWVVNLTPIGIFALLANAVVKVVEKGDFFRDLQGVMVYVFVFILGLFLQFTWQLIFVTYLTKKKAKDYILNSADTLTTAFATSSSMSSVPVALISAKKNGVSDEISRFVIPFAATISLAGTAMYEAVSAVFFSQILGINTSLLEQLMIFFVAVIAGMGATGIPEAGLIVMVTVLKAVNIPVSAIALLIPFERILDRFRTVINVWGDLVCTSTVDHVRKKLDKQNKNQGSTLENDESPASTD